MELASNEIGLGVGLPSRSEAKAKTSRRGLGFLPRVAIGVTAIYAASILLAITMTADIGFLHHMGQPVVKVQAESAAAAAGIAVGDQNPF